MSDLEAKIAKLPAWAREHIKDLVFRNEPLLDEVARSRRNIESLERTIRKQQDRIDAMHAMFQCAAKGGNEIALAVQRIVEDFLVCDTE